MKKSISLLALLVCGQLYAAPAEVSSSLSISIPADLGVYCGTTLEPSGGGFGTCATINFGELTAVENTPPVHFPNAPNGYIVDDLTFTTNSLSSDGAGGITISATGQNPYSNGSFTLLVNNNSTYPLSYTVKYQSCTQNNPSDFVAVTPTPVKISASETSEFGTNPPCHISDGTPGNGSGALYFYINGGNSINEVIPAPASSGEVSASYTDTLNVTVSAS